MSSTQDGRELFPQSNIAKSDLKIVLLGDSAVGKSKLVERFLLQEYTSQTNSTFALTLYEYKKKIGEKELLVSIWDTAGQERFDSLHPSFFYAAHAAILVFDATRKETYQHLEEWNQQLVSNRGQIPVLVAVNKIDSNQNVVKKQFKWPQDKGYPVFFVSAANGTNVVSLFEETINLAWKNKFNKDDVMGAIADVLARQAEEFKKH
uniref:Ras family protein n=1 Tax=Coptotermes formosanus TaxID=36987 RepID=L0AV69_COPFO|nr:Ras family protein [Coptotermes formosanus]